MKKISYIVILIFILSLTGCGSANIEDSFVIISELCKSNFAPISEEEYMNTYNKYKNKCVSESVLSTFFDIGKEVHTNVTMTDYTCVYTKRTGGDYGSYVATMMLSNGSIYTNIKVTFVVRDKKIVNIIISDKE